MSHRAKKWVAWIGMLLSAVLFIAADLYANELEKRSGKSQDEEPVTATGWVRKGIRSWWVIGPILAILWLVWHFFVGAFMPGLPL